MEYYFKTHFSLDPEVLGFLKTIIHDENILFHHLIALTFKYFPDIDFDETLYSRYMNGNKRHWLVRFYMIRWLYENNKIHLILISESDENYFIQREINNYKFISSNDSSFKKIYSSQLLKSKTPLISLQGLYFLFNSHQYSFNLKADVEYNDYINFIITKQPSNIIHYTLKNDWNIPNPEKFFIELGA